MRRLSIILCAIAAAFGDGACGDAEQVKRPSEELLATALNTREQAIRAALEGLERAEDLWIGDFIAILAAMRASEGVGLLTERIDVLARGWSPQVCRFECESEWYYPAARALVSIGDPSIPAVRELLLHSEDPTRRRLGVWVMVRVLGKDTATCLARQREAEAEEAVRALAEKTRHEIETFQPRYGLPEEISRDLQ